MNVQQQILLHFLSLKNEFAHYTIVLDKLREFSLWMLSDEIEWFVQYIMINFDSLQQQNVYNVTKALILFTKVGEYPLLAEVWNGYLSPKYIFKDFNKSDDMFNVKASESLQKANAASEAAAAFFIIFTETFFNISFEKLLEIYDSDSRYAMSISLDDWKTEKTDAIKNIKSIVVQNKEPF